MGVGLGAQVGAGRACVLGMQGVRAAGRAGRWGSRRWGAGAAGVERAGRRAVGARGARASGRCAGAAARAGARGAHGLSVAGRWARGLAAGCALGALGPFSIRFDSVFSRVKFFGHCS